MKRTTCLICSRETSGRPASIARFVVETCNLGTAATEIRYCRACDFAFFARRLTDQEAAKLYNRYRGDDYNTRRIAVEPSYASLVPLFADPLSSYYVERIHEYTDVMDVFPEIRPATVLDFGGDGSVPSRVFPYAEIAFDDLSAGAGGQTWDMHELIFVSQVFEHVSDPVALLKGVVGRLAPEGVVFIDLPKEFESTLSEGLLWQAKHGGGLYTMHEHINHFSQRSLRLLMQAAGLEPFFEVEPIRHRTWLAMGARPGSEAACRFRAEKAMRTLLWGQTAIRQIARNAQLEAQASHAYARQACQTAMAVNPPCALRQAAAMVFRGIRRLGRSARPT
ncbi:MAG: class I SAM-dependent methyltransferase [Rhodopila sp.]|nr:class I SAM-dependent methyltransferase [Rhodopila sp.]